MRDSQCGFHEDSHTQDSAQHDSTHCVDSFARESCAKDSRAARLANYILALFARFQKPLIFLIIAYSVGVAAIALANYSYQDDLRRQLFGVSDWGDLWSRPLSDVLANVLFVNTYLFPISPYHLVICVLLLSISSLILAHAIAPNHAKSRYFLLACSLSLGLNPYFLQNLSYKFDSVFMVLSLFLQILPFAFLGRTRGFVIATIIAIPASYSLYQASSGAFVIIAIFIVFRNYLSAMPLARNLTLALVFGVSYLAGCGIYRFFIYEPAYDYAFAVIASAKSLVPVSLGNIHTYLSMIWDDWSKTFLFKLFVALCVLFVAKATLTSAKPKLPSFILSIVALISMLCLSYGAYIILIKPIFEPRAFVGLGVFMAIVAMWAMDFTSEIKAIVSGILAIALAHSLIVFANHYGNALVFQREFDTLQTSMLLQDLNKIPRSQDDIIVVEKTSLYEFAPVVRGIGEHYPLILGLVRRWQHAKYYDLVNNGVNVAWRRHSCDGAYIGEAVDTNAYNITIFAEDSADKPPAKCFLLRFKD